MRNVEAKFRLANPELARERAHALGFISHANFTQHDTFFNVTNGKLKLRAQEQTASLIYYRRERRGGLELSNYEIVPLTNGPAMRAILGKSLGIIAEVRKRRVLMMRANVRFHLDTVEELGDFGELEAVLSEREEEEPNRRVLAEILSALGISSQDLIEKSYCELLSDK
jgi:adenylate cyclase class 2